MTEELRNQLLLFWSGELDPAERAGIEERLAADSEAQDYLDELNLLSSQIDKLADPDTSGVASRAIERELRSGEKKVVAFPLWKRVIWPAAIAAAIIIAVFFIPKAYQPDSPSTPPVVKAPSPVPETSKPTTTGNFIAERRKSDVSKRVRSAQARIKRIRERFQS